MIAQTYCGKEMAPVSTDTGDVRWPVCGPEDGPCPSCLRDRIAKLEARIRELEAQAKAARINLETAAALDAQAATQAGGVVPELMIESRDPHDIPEGCSARWINDPEREKGGYWAYPAPRPASRVLGDGEVAVGAERLVMHQENTALIAKMRCALRSGASDKAIVDALRAQAQTEGVEA